MLAVFATLAFLIAMWLCATITVGTLEQSGFKIIAALKGRPLLASPALSPTGVRFSQRYPSLPQRPMRTQVALRAAA